MVNAHVYESITEDIKSNILDAVNEKILDFNIVYKLLFYLLSEYEIFEKRDHVKLKEYLMFKEIDVNLVKNKTATKTSLMENMILMFLNKQVNEFIDKYIFIKKDKNYDRNTLLDNKLTLSRITELKRADLVVISGKDIPYSLRNSIEKIIEENIDLHLIKNKLLEYIVILQSNDKTKRRQTDSIDFTKLPFSRYTGEDQNAVRVLRLKELRFVELKLDLDFSNECLKNISKLSNHIFNFNGIELKLNTDYLEDNNRYSSTLNLYFEYNGLDIFKKMINDGFNFNEIGI